MSRPTNREGRTFGMAGSELAEITGGKPKPQVVTHTLTGKSDPHPSMLCECEDRKREILEALRAGPSTPKALAARLNKDRGTVRWFLGKLLEAGLVRKTPEGVYELSLSITNTTNR
jgi:hypothetical protein